jgi:glycosidase
MKWRFEEANKHKAYIALISGNHDTQRIADSLKENELKIFYMFMLAMPGTPFIYYGDELMMKTMPLDSKDGGYQRTGVRIPMLWDNSKNFGFSKTNGETYLPFYKENKITAVDAIKDKNSMYHFIKDMIALRKQYDSLRDNKLEIEEENKVIKIKRGEDLELIINLSENDYSFNGKVLISSNEVENNCLKPHSSVIFQK